MRVLKSSTLKRKKPEVLKVHLREDKLESLRTEKTHVTQYLVLRQVGDALKNHQD